MCSNPKCQEITNIADLPKAQAKVIFEKRNLNEDYEKMRTVVEFAALSPTMASRN